MPSLESSELINLCDTESINKHYLFIITFIKYMCNLYKKNESRFDLYSRIVPSYTYFKFKSRSSEPDKYKGFKQNLIFYNNAINSETKKNISELKIYIIENEFNEFLKGENVKEKGIIWHILKISKKLKLIKDNSCEKLAFSNQEVAIKVIHNGTFENNRDIIKKEAKNSKLLAINEIENLRKYLILEFGKNSKEVNKIKQPIIYLYSENNNNLFTNIYSFIIMPFFEGITLCEYLDIQENAKNYSKNYKIYMEILKKYDKLHKNELVHCDIHSKNIILDQNNSKIKIIDFDRSGSISSIADCGFIERYLKAFHYQICPELIEEYIQAFFKKDTRYHPSLDIFALGGLFLSMFFKYPYVNSLHKIFENIRKIDEVYKTYFDFLESFSLFKPYFCTHIPPEVYYFIMKYMINFLPEERMPLEKIINYLTFYEEEFLGNNQYSHDVEPTLSKFFRIEEIFHQIILFFNAFQNISKIQDNCQLKIAFNQEKQNIKTLARNYIFTNILTKQVKEQFLLSLKNIMQSYNLTSNFGFFNPAQKNHFLQELLNLINHIDNDLEKNQINSAGNIKNFSSEIEKIGFFKEQRRGSSMIVPIIDYEVKMDTKIRRKTI